MTVEEYGYKYIIKIGSTTEDKVWGCINIHIITD